MKKIYAGFLAALMVTGLALSGCGNVQIDGADSKNTTSNTSSSLFFKTLLKIGP